MYDDSSDNDKETKRGLNLMKERFYVLFFMINSII